MTNNIYTLRKLADHFSKIVSGNVISEAFSQEKGKLDIVIASQKGNRVIEFSSSRKLPYMILRDDLKKSSRNVASLFEEFRGRTIVSVEIFEDQRAISFALDNADKIVFSFFGNPNCFLTGEGVVRKSFKENNLNSGKRISDIFGSKPVQSETETSKLPADVVKNKFPQLGELYRKELLHRLEEDGITAGDNLLENKLDEYAKELINEIESGENLLYETDSGPVMSLIELRHLENAPSKKFESINELIRTYVISVLRNETNKDLRKSRLAVLEKRLREEQRKSAGIRDQLEHCRNSSLFRRSGEAILANIGNIASGQKLLKVTDEDGAMLEIKLKPELSAPQNAAAYFEKSKRQKSSTNLLQEKIKRSEEKINELMREIELAVSSEDIKALKKENKKQKNMEADETRKFRKFRVEGDLEVWVGKDSASNEMLTKRYSAQNDLWFHVRGASGSHTVLKVPGKKEQIQKSAIESAAAIAAYYSKARNAGSVPVAYCERKYVKKKKGFKEGTVLMEREKVVFVRPALPEE